MRSTLLLMTALVASPAFANVSVGQPAPNFTVASSSGKPVSLSDYKGKTVVLEWSNDTCPFVKKFYDQGNMQALQKRYTSAGVIWLTVSSSASGKPGFVADTKAAQAWLASQKAQSTALLLDTKGDVGRLYGAKTTPHVFVIDPAGKLAYAGAMDSTPSADSADIATATPYLQNAVDAVIKGQPVTVASSKPYGCSVKY
jgi:peroxiredoxin